jgi:phage replication O-like protein O
MASPQVENGYVKIATELVEAFARYSDRGEERVLWAILRKTYGWHKKEDHISIGQIQKMTRLSRRMVIYGLQNLEAKKVIYIVRQQGRGHVNVINTIGLQKNHDLWVVQEKSEQWKKDLKRRKLTYQKSKQGGSAGNRGSAGNDTGGSAGFLHPQKKLSQKKKTYTLECFEQFWAEYPNKIKRKAAEKAFLKISPLDEKLFNKIMESLRAYKNTKNWKKDGGQFIPHSASWINGEQWNDEIESLQDEDRGSTPKQSNAPKLPIQDRDGTVRTLDPNKGVIENQEADTNNEEDDSDPVPF